MSDWVPLLPIRGAEAHHVLSKVSRRGPAGTAVFDVARNTLIYIFFSSWSVNSLPFRSKELVLRSEDKRVLEKNKKVRATKGDRESFLFYWIDRRSKYWKEVAFRGGVRAIYSRGQRNTINRFVQVSIYTFLCLRYEVLTKMRCGMQVMTAQDAVENGAEGLVCNTPLSWGSRHILINNVDKAGRR